MKRFPDPQRAEVGERSLLKALLRPQMARKVGVLDSHQEATALPSSFVTRCVAKLLVRRLLADWIVENFLIQRRCVRLTAEVPTAVVPIQCKPLPLNPPGYHVMSLQAYPEPNLATVVHPHAAFLRECLLARNSCETRS